MSAVRRENRYEQELRSIISDIPGNDICADCETPNPAWASYNLGVFLCTRCASIHRKNSDISKVKSISLDIWLPDQVRTMREVGNTSSNYKFNPLRELPIQNDDSTMEQFIRNKYEGRRFMGQKEGNFVPVRSALKGSQGAATPSQSSSAMIKYSKELDTLREMGFTDRTRNVDVLKSVMGDVASATDVLVAMESTDGKVPPKKPERPRVRFTDDTIGGLDIPYTQSGNPFAMMAQGQGSSQYQFASMPPSLLYASQAGHQQTNSPFMGYQGTSSGDPTQQLYQQPAMPLRQQLTGGQPLRPQSQTEQMMQPQLVPPQQQQIQQQIQEPPRLQQPLVHQLTGRPTPAGYMQQQQQQQQPPSQLQAVSQYDSHLYQDSNQVLRPQQTGPQYPSLVPYQTLQSASTFSPAPSADPQMRPPSTMSNMRPPFRPTVDLSMSSQLSGNSGNTVLPQIQQGRSSLNPMTTLLSEPQFRPSPGISPQPSGAPRASMDTFGSGFVTPLQTELGNIQRQNTGAPNGYVNPFQAHPNPPQAPTPALQSNYNLFTKNQAQPEFYPQQLGNNQHTSNMSQSQSSFAMNNKPSNGNQGTSYLPYNPSSTPQELHNQSSGQNYYQAPSEPFRQANYSTQPMLQQSTGNQRPVPTFQAGVDQFARQPPYANGQSFGGGAQPLNMQQTGPVQLQQQMTGPGRPEAFYGQLRPQQSMQPQGAVGKPFDKSSIMSLYGTQPVQQYGLQQQAFPQSQVAPNQYNQQPQYGIMPQNTGSFPAYRQ